MLWRSFPFALQTNKNIVFALFSEKIWNFSGVCLGIFGHFTKFNFRKKDFSQNSISEKRTLHKIQYQKNGLFTKFIIGKMDSSQNSVYRHESFYHFLRIPRFFFCCCLKLFKSQILPIFGKIITYNVRKLTLIT